MTKYVVKNIMVPNIAILDPETSLREATQLMEEIDCGLMPVGTRDELMGVITDRDIAIRAIARGRDPQKTKVKEIMTNKVLSVSEDADLVEAAEMIKKHNVNRLIVKNRKGKVRGIVSLTGLIREASNAKVIALFVQNLPMENHRKVA